MATDTTQTTSIPKFAYPFAEKSKKKYKDSLDVTAEGNYLFTQHGFWHGGIHFEGNMLSDLKTEKGIKCIADGEIVAYRMNDTFFDEGRGQYSTGFFLVKHKIEYPANNKGVFFSLYMHTAKKDDYFVKTKGEDIFLRSGYEKSAISPAVGEELAVNTKIIVDGKWIQNRARVLYVEGREIDLRENLTLHKSNVDKESEVEFFKNIGQIFKNYTSDSVTILDNPISIKAGETIGLMGEYNVEGEKDIKCLHLEVFASEEFKTFVQNAQMEDEKLAQSFNWATVLDEESSDNVSIFKNIRALYDESEDLKLSGMYMSLFNLIDKDQNGQMEVQELEDAAKDKAIKNITNKYIVKHSSEWDKSENMAEKLIEVVEGIPADKLTNKEEVLKDLELEKARITNLSFFSQCKGKIAGFPSGDMVYVINLIGLVNEFNKGCQITKEMLVAMGCTTASNNQPLIDALNKYCEQYEINTCLRIAHFLAQAAHESGGFTTQTEDDTYRESIALQSSCYKKYRESPEGKNIQLTPRIKNGSVQRDNEGNIIYNCKQPEYFNCKYANKNGNGDFTSGDGHKYRGRGIMQLTGRETYRNYKNDHNQRNPNDVKDFVANPELVTSSKEYEVASGCSYWFNKTRDRKNLNLWADEGSSDEVVLKISALINGFYDEKASKYNRFSDTEKAKYLKAGDDLYLKIPNGYNEPNKPFSRLPLFHKLKNHMGL